jgi:hypothetical protein
MLGWPRLKLYYLHIATEKLHWGSLFEFLGKNSLVGEVTENCGMRCIHGCIFIAYFKLN